MGKGIGPLQALFQRVAILLRLAFGVDGPFRRFEPCLARSGAPFV
jgi:hypothetical protein